MKLKHKLNIVKSFFFKFILKVHSIPFHDEKLENIKLIIIFYFMRIEKVLPIGA